VLRSTIVPLYHQLRLELSEKIESGSWPPGHCLPPETGLATEFGVSRATVRQAMQFLEREGLVERVKGRGTFVSRPKVTHNLLAIGSAFDRSGASGPIPVVEMHHILRTPASSSVATQLQLGRGEEVYELAKVLSEEGEPLMLITSWLPVRRFPALDEKPLRDPISMRQVMHDYYGIEIVHQHKEIEVTILDEEEASILDCSPGSPALLITYLSRPSTGEPVELRKWVIRGDRCKCYLDLETPELLV
jgi:GntR family transcriptional regulator